MTKITLFGMAGTGKGTIAQLLKERLGYEQTFSAGNFEREVAKKRGMTLLELDEIAKTDNGATDKEQDRVMAEFGKTHDNFIVEGRLAWYFIPDSFKVSLLCSFEERTRRIAMREKKNIAVVQEETREREKAIYERFEKYYGITDFENPKNFDFVIDTTHLTPEQIVDQIVRALKEKALVSLK